MFLNDLKDVQNKRVLIIDDEVDLCLLLKIYLLRKGCSVFITYTIHDAFQNMKRTIPDVIILDVNLCVNPNSTIQKILEIAPNVQIFKTPVQNH